MIAKVHIRVAKHPRGRKGYQVDASLTENQRPLENGAGKVLPTCAFALELDIPDQAFHSAARVVAKLKVPEEKLTIAAEVLEHDLA